MVIVSMEISRFCFSFFSDFDLLLFVKRNIGNRHQKFLFCLSVAIEKLSFFFCFSVAIENLTFLFFSGNLQFLV